MKRLLLIVLVAGLLALGGCVDGEVSSDDDVATGDGDELDDAASNETGTDDGDDESDTVPEVDGELELHHIDVGQADATLLVEPSGETMLIDSGDWPQDGSDVIAYLEARGIDRIDHLVATHAHADHIGGHAAIIDHYETERDGIGTVYDSGIAHTSQTYENYLDAMEEHEIEPLIVDEGDEFAFGDAHVDVLNPPTGDSDSDFHYNSVTLEIQFGGFSYLTTGDAEVDAEQRMVDDYGDDLDADVYQAGHHGSDTSSTAPFLNQVTPEVAVISSAYDSQYDHPSDEVLQTFADRGIETYWTAVHGDIVVTTDGETHDVETASEFSTEPADLLEAKPDDEDDDEQASIDPAPAPAAVSLAG